VATDEEIGFPQGSANETELYLRWIDGVMQGQPVTKEESEYRPGPELTVAAALAAYRARADATRELYDGVTGE
jgi:hypothetical protein